MDLATGRQHRRIGQRGIRRNGYALATVFLVIAACSLHAWIEPRFFYWDDAQHTFAPVFYEIGRQLRAGVWPISTPLLWQGGFLAGEGLYQLFNPISLAIFLALPSIDDISLGMTTHATIWLVFAALGVHLLAVRLGSSPPWATMAGLSYATSPFLLYWLAASWVNGLVAYSTLPWVLFFLARRSPGIWSILGLALCTFMLGVSGWIHAMIASVAFGWWRVFAPQADLPMRSRLLFALGLAAGALGAAPQLLATVATVHVGIRPSNISNAGRAIADLQGLAVLFWPTYARPIVWFDGLRWSPPVFYAAWFLLPAFALALQRLRQTACEFGWLIWPSLICIIASLGPEQFGPTRWPIRFLPAAWAALIPVGAAIISRHHGGGTSFSLRGAVIALALAALISWQQFPDNVLLLLAFLATLILGCWMVLRLPASTRSPASVVSLGITMLVPTWMAFAYPVNSALEDYFGPKSRFEIQATGVNPPGSVVQIYSRLNRLQPSDGGLPTDDHQRWASRPFSSDENDWLPSGNMSLWRGERLVNGYSPVEMLSIKTLLCGQSIFGWTCDGPTRSLEAVERRTNTRFADLMRIESIVVSKRMPRSLNELSQSPRWELASSSEYATTFRRRRAGPEYPGTISYLPPSTQLVAMLGSDNWSETLELNRLDDFRQGIIVFARPWYPGYLAVVDGQESEVTALGGVLAAVEVPPGTGPVNIRIEHRLPMPAIWRALVALALAALALAWFLARRRFAGRDDQAQDVPSCHGVQRQAHDL